MINIELAIDDTRNRYSNPLRLLGDCTASLRTLEELIWGHAHPKSEEITDVNARDFSKLLSIIRRDLEQVETLFDDGIIKPTASIPKC